MSRDAYIIAPFCEEPEQIECTITVWIWKIVAPILFVIGATGNILNLIVLTRKQMRTVSSTVYLLSLTVLYFITVVCLLSRQFLLRFNIEVKNLSSFNCIVHVWLTNTGAGFSAWILVLLTGERVLCTIWPIWARQRITRKESIITVITLLIILISLSVHLLFMFELKVVPKYNLALNGTNNVTENIKVCLARTEPYQEYIHSTFRVLVMVLLNIFPLIFITTGNIIIAITLYLKKRNRNIRVHPQSDSQSGQPTILDNRLRSSAKILFVLSACFVFTTLPFTIFAVIKAKLFSDVTDIQLKARLQLVQCFALLLLSFNYSINFLLFVFSGSMFRNELKKVIKCIKEKGLRLCGRD